MACSHYVVLLIVNEFQWKRWHTVTQSVTFVIAKVSFYDEIIGGIKQ